MNDMTQDMINKIMTLNKTSLRLVVTLLLMTILGVNAAWGKDNPNYYVFIADGHYVTYDGTSTTLSHATSFSPSSCVWKMASRSKTERESWVRFVFQENNDRGYYLNYSGTNDTPGLQSSSFDNWIFNNGKPDSNTGTTNGGGPLRLNKKDGNENRMFLYWDDDDQWQTSGSTEISDDVKVIGYGVDITEVPANAILTIDCPSIIDMDGCQATVTGSKSEVAFTNYYFNDTNHYWYGGTNHNVSPTITSVDLSNVAWSLTGANDSEYASVDSETGEITVKKIAIGDVTLTLTCQATADNGTITASKTIILNGAYYVMKNSEGYYVQKEGSNLTGTKSFNPDNSVWNNVSYDNERKFYTVGSSSNPYYLSLAGWQSGTVYTKPGIRTTGSPEWKDRWCNGSNNSDIIHNGTNYKIYRDEGEWALNTSPADPVKLYAVAIEKGNVTDVKGDINEDYGIITVKTNKTYTFTATPYIRNTYYTKYTFDGSTHYWFDGGDHTTEPETWGNISDGDLTKTWSLATADATYASVNPSTGVLTISNLPASGQAKITLTCTISHGGKEFKIKKELILGEEETEISNLSGITSTTGKYRLASNFSTTGTLGISGAFSGTINGGLVPITGTWDKPLFDVIDGAIIKNVIIQPGSSSVSISGNSTGNAGAICNEAKGASRIYNCGILPYETNHDEEGNITGFTGISVSGSKYVGGLVGLLDGTSRVINCFSYANVSGGNDSDVGGIVGYNTVASKQTNIATMVMNCMFYGNITAGKRKSPIYGGSTISNLNSGGLSNFNYYCYETLTGGITSYNCALAVEEKYLNRFEYYRLLLNSNKKLAAIYASTPGPDGTNPPTFTPNVTPEEMAKWVLETADRTIDNPKPYPVLKHQGYYPSIVNIDADNAPTLILENNKPKDSDRNKGGRLGTLSVFISESNTTTGGQTKPTGATVETTRLTLVRTDMDKDRYNFNYDKVQLPYYNDVGTKNYTGNRVVTGWKITSITTVANDPYTSANYDYTKTYSSNKSYFDGPNYNFADRKSSNKDLYDVSGRVFSQGAYFDVPYGVISITIEPYWGKAAYIADPNYDVVYSTGYATQNVTQTGTQVDGSTLFDGEKLGTTGQVVKTKISDALTYISGTLGGYGSTVYDNAVVLVGNFHQSVVPSDGINPFTIMSVDTDNDHEPDYSMIYYHSGKKGVSPIRFDFLNIPGAAQAQKPSGADKILNMAIIQPKGWFEITNTSSIYFSQFEYENLNNLKNISGTSQPKYDSPLILQGGIFDQFVSTNSLSVPGYTIYIHVGGNVWIKEFGMGTHSDGSKATPHVPVSVTGGEYEGFYLTGTYNQDADVTTDNAECCISGGHFKEVAGAGQEAINGNVRWQIYNADIDNFFGGGTNGATGKNIKGDITVDIFNSHVTTFCGGPKFGNMESGKEVITNADGCVFGQFFGAGYGGTAYSRKKYYDKEGISSSNWTTYANDYISDRGKYFDGATNGLGEKLNNGTYKFGYKGIGVATDLDYEFFVYSTGNTGGRFFVKFASFSLAQCNDVESNLTNCIIKNNFYGGGNLGAVTGTAKSVLDDCTVKGSVYGAGYSATKEPVKVRDAGFLDLGNNKYAVPNYNKNSGMFEPATKSGTTEFTWQNVAKAGVTLTNGQSGLNESNGNHILYTDVVLDALGQVNTTDLTIKGETTVEGSVYGGGEQSGVKGNTEVKLQEKAHVLGDVYGGGKGIADNFECDKAMVGEVNQGVNAQGVMQPGGTTVNITNGTVEGSVYGGGEIARVERNTVVTIGAESGASAPVIRGSVFGAGKGEKTHGYSALVRGTATVIVQGDAKVGESVYGGGEIASVGNFFVKGVTYPAALNAPTPPEDFPVGMPYALKYPNTASGTCTVTIRGNAEIGPDNMEMPTYSGHVFGAGKGILPEVYNSSNKPQRMTLAEDKVTSIWESFENEPAYIEFIETLGMSAATEVSIEGNAFVKGSVYGGSENGHVLKDTHVTIAGGQIGNGDDGQNRRFTGWDSENASDFTECNHWPYGKQVGTTKVYLPYDVYDLDADNKPKAASDGHTFYGNVFGGGSGYFPYRSRVASLNLDTNPWVKDATKSAEVGQPVDANGYSDGKWLRSAGAVYGNTFVNITGGHILTSVYGGNEQTDVGKYQTSFTTADAGTGKCTVNMSGGTIGVPRTEQQMKDHPVTCYLFGAGKGDQRINFNTWTNVASVEVNITGGRIFGSVFGGGEDGHVMGDVEMNIGQETGKTTKIGTTGTSYVDGNVFGGGRGFSGDAQTAGTVGGNIELNITGGLMLGSVYGGGRLASVGTQFTSPDDDNYGNFVEDNEAVLYTAQDEEVIAGTKQEGDVKTPAGNYGHVTINISGGTVGNEVGNAVSGNVFGGSMGRLELLNGGINPVWPKMAQVKTTAVNIYKDAIIKRSVYGGGELGTVRDNAYVTIGGYKTADVDANGVVGVSVQGGGTVGRDVYGGGYGSEDDDDHTIFTVKELPDKDDATYQSAPTVLVDHTYAFTPMQFAGCVGQNTYVHICGGQVKKSVYGGGELASVGIINCRAKEVTSEPSADKVVVEHKNGSNKWTIYSNMVKHAPEKDSNDNDIYYGFGLSWPYEFIYMPGFDGATHVHITGGRIGLKEGTDTNNFEDGDNGDVCGGGKGKAGDYNDYVFCANVGSTEVKIEYENTLDPATTDYEADGECIVGAVYGGAENGHVMGDTKLTLEGGLVGHSIYGGGSGKGQFKTWLKKIEGISNVVSTSSGTAPNTNANGEYEATCYSITAGKVFGNTEVEMSGGYVVRNVYGGGNMGSVGKGNYSGGSDDYYAPGYGELPPSDNQSLWTTAYTEENKTKDFPWYFLNSGICTVKITGGEVGYINESDLPNSLYPKEIGLPYGNVFGGSRGVSAPNIGESPRYLYCPEFFMGYVNETSVTIGTENDNTDGPKIAASVYGGGMDGHVRRDASVKIYSGKIGRTYDATKLNAFFWANIGNVYGAGSGTGQYQYDFNYDGDYEDVVTYLNPQTNRSSTMKETDFSTSAGSVTRFTEVEVKGGTVHRNVYGGGSLSTVGAPKIPVNGVMPPDPFHPNDSQHSSDVGKQSLNKVTIAGGKIGDASSYDTNGNHVYGGYVFGASRGDDTLENPASFATAVWTDVNINPHTDSSKSPIIYGDVYGGGEVGTVRQSTDVDLTGGTIKHDAYGGGRGTETVAANVGADATISLNNGVASDKKGCIVSRIFGCNNMNGSPQGHTKVHVYATQNKNKTTIQDGKTTANLHTAMETEGTPSTYDVAAVYGGGNMAPYYPSTTTESTESTEVIIDGCDVTSIKQVYGGGNAASTPATSVTVNGTYEIEELFGGGNGKDKVSYDGGLNYLVNPGANVGYKDYHEVENDPLFATKEARVDGDDFAEYRYGSGVATVNIFGGLVHHVFGGSNTKGNVRKTALTLLEEKKEDGETPCCPFQVDEAYGGGKSAPMDAEAILHMACIPGLKVAYGGAQEADVQDNVTLTITNGTFDQVFGGNNISGIIRGSITVNIEETGCKPIIIGELYGGGNLAGYSVYGYKKESRTVTETDPDTGSEITKTEDVWVPIEDASESELTTPSKDPVVNVKSFTSIGTVYGGGLGSTAIMVGNPTVNINVAEGERASETAAVIGKDGDNWKDMAVKNGQIVEKTIADSYPIPYHKSGEIGAINNVFGGGNAAKVVGKTTVNVGTKIGDDEYMAVNVKVGDVLPASTYYTYDKTNSRYVPAIDTTAQEGTTYYKKYEIKGVDIRGNVYGGGNQAEVTGDADVIIGKKNQ